MKVQYESAVLFLSMLYANTTSINHNLKILPAQLCQRFQLNIVVDERGGTHLEAVKKLEAGPL